MNKNQPNTTVPTPQIKGQYIALISQAGTAAPTIIILKNTLPTTGNPIWTRESAGVYRFTSSITNYFPAGKVTFNYAPNFNQTTKWMIIGHDTTERISIITVDGGISTDAMLAFTPIEIILWDRIED